MIREPYTLAISPCPNDTFAFYGLLQGKVGYNIPLETSFADIEALNHLCFEGAADFCKISFHAYVLARAQYRLLSAGAALGFGCGPLLVARHHLPLDHLCQKTIAIPGRFTTATLLLKLMLGGDLNTVEMVFDEIMPAVAEGVVDAGLIIHESRFTFPEHGLVSLIDLGEWWEHECGLPIPLGGIVCHKKVPEMDMRRFDRALADSIDYAWSHEGEVVPFMRSHAQEMDPVVMKNHVDLYVNDYTRALGDPGWAAIEFLVRESERKGLGLSHFG